MTGLYFMRGAAAVVCLAVAVAAGAQNREAVKAPVFFGDLKLATVSGQATFKHRIHNAASATCVSGASGIAADIDRARCMNEMMRDGDTHLAMLIAAPATQFASATETRQPAK